MSTRDRAHVVSTLNWAVRQFMADFGFSGLAVANRLGLLPTDLQLLSFLELYGAATPGSLARYTWLSSGGITVALDRLERAGYIRRHANPADRRSWLVSIRPAQARRIATKYASAQTRFHAALAQFNKPELKILLRFFSAANERGLKAMEGGGKRHSRRGSGGLAVAAQSVRRSRPFKAQPS